MNDIMHIEEKGFFIFDNNKNVIAEMTYVKNENILIFNHTWTNPSLQGQGIAAKLVNAGADYARKNGFKVMPTCQYVVKKFQSGEYDDIKL